MPQERWSGDALYREPNIRLQPVQPDTGDMTLPPAIPISADGEEGYVNSQRHLVSTQDPTELVSAPPNRTIKDCESPPPYRSRSVGSLGHLERHSDNRPLRHHHSDSSSGGSVRCYSLSNNNNNNKVRRDSNVNTTTSTTSTNPSSSSSCSSSSHHHAAHSSHGPFHPSHHHLPAPPPYGHAVHHTCSPSEGMAAAAATTHGQSRTVGGGASGQDQDPPPDYCDVIGIANITVYNGHSSQSGNVSSGV